MVIFFPSLLKKDVFSIVVAMLICINFANAQNSLLTLERHQTPFGNLDKTPQLGHVVYSRQPDAKTIAMLKDKGFKMVVSIRYEDEPVGFDSRNVVEENGMSFVQISLLSGSIKDEPRYIDDAAVTEIRKVIVGSASNGGKILLHCESGQRAGAALGAILYRDFGYSKEEALMNANKAGLTSDYSLEFYNRYIEKIAR
jgi:protein tyrosine phosphatase (PTP) superfamily phosphohydrolase (DUF442 family)